MFGDNRLNVTEVPVVRHISKARVQIYNLAFVLGSPICITSILEEGGEGEDGGAITIAEPPFLYMNAFQSSGGGCNRDMWVALSR